MLSIQSVEVGDDYWLRLGLSDGSAIERNVRELMLGPVFETLRTDYAAFRRARARHGTVEWPGDLDLAPETLIWDGPTPSDESAPPPLPRVVLRHPRQAQSAG
jgi:hypothetical protein